MATCNNLRTYGILYDRLVHFVFIYYIFSVLVLCTKKNLATLDVNVFSGGIYRRAVIAKIYLSQKFMADGFAGNRRNFIIAAIKTVSQKAVSKTNVASSFVAWPLNGAGHRGFESRVYVPIYKR
jgi:hypothetical protein